MWQVLLAAAAAAGSGILAKKLLVNPIDSEKPISGSTENDQEGAQNDDAFKENVKQEKMEMFGGDGKIFRFSSSDAGPKELKKHTRNGFKGLKKNGGSKKGKKIGAAESGGEKELAVDHRGNGNGKKISICLKKRRTWKHVAGKCESCSFKDNSFGWGVGVGIMYMMTAGNAEIGRLSSAMDDTIKTVQELKAEITKRKSSLNENESGANGKYFGLRNNGPENNLLTYGPASVEEGECSFSDSILKEDQQPEVLEMDRLEAEFESELQKLHWCATEGSGSEGRTDILEAEILAKERHIEDREHLNSSQFNGVLPVELDGKLHNLLIEQQESQITELEAELHNAHSKLHEKEAELQALKDCVKRLTEFSLANASDEETEHHEEVVETRRDGIEPKVGFESTESMVGMKRSLGYDSYICSTN